MKTWEWIALIILTGLLDIVQVILDFFVIGVVLNRIIDIVVGILLPVYFWFRGVNMGDWKKLLTAFGGFALEEVGLGGDDGLPFWTLEVGVVWAFVVAEKKAASNPLLSKAMGVMNKMGSVTNMATDMGPLNQAGKRLPSAIQQPLNQGGVRLPNGGVS
jgi:hypothetical protein